MTDSTVTLFVKAGWDGKCLGACHQSQRVLMLAKLKLTSGMLPAFQVVPVNVTRPPEAFSSLGLRLRVPALYLGSKAQEPIDVPDEIVSSLEEHYPGGLLPISEVTESESATRDFFSRFCFFIRDVSKNSNHLESELRNLDDFLKGTGNAYLCGSKPSLLDCEVLPKLHQVRVASAGIKELIKLYIECNNNSLAGVALYVVFVDFLLNLGPFGEFSGYEIPASLENLWRYLHTAYSEPAFAQSCPSDTEILLHWLDHVGESGTDQRKHLLTSYKKSAQYSFTVPVFARCAQIE